jgi:NTE family protein
MRQKNKKEQSRKSRLKTAFVFSGGGSKGALQVGMLKTLLKKIRPDLLIGTSIGSVNAALLASGKDIKDIEKIWHRADQKEIFVTNRKLILQLTHAESIYSGKGMRQWLKGFLGDKKIERSKIPLRILGTRLSDGKHRFFSKGSMLEAVKASCAIPPLLPPHKISGTKYIDGIFSGTVGLREARQLGCKQIIILNAGISGSKQSVKVDMKDLVQRGIEFLAYHAIKTETELCKDCHIVQIDPDSKKDYNITDFRYSKALIRKGEEQARKCLRSIRM